MDKSSGDNICFLQSVELYIKDNGRTWQLIDMKLPREIPLMHCYHNEGILLEDKTYILSVYGNWDISDQYGSCFVYRTKDGVNWDANLMAMSETESQGFCEPAIAQASNGDVVTIMRTSAQRELWTTISSDSGKTWEKPWILDFEVRRLGCLKAAMVIW